jgi:hypothetical protein
MTASRFVHLCAIVLISALLAACGARQSSVQGLPTTSGAAPDVLTPADGGAFSANYAGSWGRSQCIDRGELFSLGGSGSALFPFLHRSSEGGQLISNPEYMGLCSGPWKGWAKIASHKYPSDTITFNLSDGFPCGGASFNVRSGTGKFAFARGSGTVRFNCAGSTYSDQWSGTISF